MIANPVSCAMTMTARTRGVVAADLLGEESEARCGRGPAETA